MSNPTSKFCIPICTYVYNSLRFKSTHHKYIIRIIIILYTDAAFAPKGFTPRKSLYSAYILYTTAVYTIIIHMLLLYFGVYRWSIQLCFRISKGLTMIPYFRSTISYNGIKAPPSAKKSNVKRR